MENDINDTMTGDSIELLDEQIERMKGGGTLSENEVKILCDRVSAYRHELVAVGHDDWANFPRACTFAALPQ